MPNANFRKSRRSINSSPCEANVSRHGCPANQRTRCDPIGSSSHMNERGDHPLSSRCGNSSPVTATPIPAAIETATATPSPVPAATPVSSAAKTPVAPAAPSPTPTTAPAAAAAPPHLLDLRFVQIVVIGDGVLRELIRLRRIAGQRLRRKRRGACSGYSSRTCGGDTKRELEKTAAIHDASSDVLLASRIPQRA